MLLFLNSISCVIVLYICYLLLKYVTHLKMLSIKSLHGLIFCMWHPVVKYPKDIS